MRLDDVYQESEIHADGSATVKVHVYLASHDVGRRTKARVRAVVRGKGFADGPFEAEQVVTVTGADLRRVFADGFETGTTGAWSATQGGQS